MSNADSLNELMGWITEDVTNDNYRFVRVRRRRTRTTTTSGGIEKDNNMSNHKTRFLGSSCSFKLEQIHRFENTIGGFVHQLEYSPNAES